MVLITLIFMTFISSCSTEEIVTEAETEVVDDNEDNDPDEDGTDDNDNNPAVDTSLPCDFTLTSIPENSTIIINCVLDLEGNTISLPQNVNIKYEGGEIKNGTLVFSGGTIDGDLLNITLGINGNANLSSNVFNFNPNKWDIVQGATNKETSLTNRKNINKAIELVDSMGADVFEIEKMDAYFNVEANKVNREYHSDRSIRIPSNFHLKMGDKTFLRVQPTHFPSYSLITTYVKDNVKISGGNLIGDRWEHDYSPIVDIAGVARDTHGYGFLLYIIGSHNVTVENVTFKEAIGDGITVHAKTIRNPDGTLGADNRTSENVLIKDCLFDEIRRNGIAVLDADGVLIDNCDVLNTGNGEQAFDASGNKISSSAGTAPRYGIDLESLRYIGDDGTVNEINKIENVVIRNSRFRGNEAGDIVVYTATDVIVENNYFDKWVANFASTYVTIRNNTFESRDPSFFAIGIQSYIVNVRGELNHNYTISNNTIRNYRTGMWVAGKNQTVTNNNIIDCVTGILLISDLHDSEFSGNTITSDLDVSFGYKNIVNMENTNNVNISDETINVKNRPISLINFFDQSALNSTQISFKGCSFNTDNTNFKLHVQSGKNLEFDNNTSNTDFEIIDSENIVLENNSTNVN